MSPRPAVLGDCHHEGVLCTLHCKANFPGWRWQPPPNTRQLCCILGSAGCQNPTEGSAESPPKQQRFVTLALWQTALKPASPSRGCDVGIVAFSSAQAGPRLLLLQRFILTAGGGYGNVSPRDSRCCVMCPAEVMRSQLAETSFRLSARQAHSGKHR